MPERKRLIFDDDNDLGLDWVVTYHLGFSDYDDDIYDGDVVEVILSAIDFDTAVKYAQQYLRKMQTEDSDEDWSTAQILSVELR